MNGWEAIGPVLYLWLKAAHIIFVIFWVAGLFLLPRFYIYHQEAGVGSPEAARWVDREAKLRNIILTPSMGMVWLLGIAIATIGPSGDPSLGTWWTAGWLHVKLLFVLGLSAYHGYMVGYGRKLAKGQAPASGKALRLMNELPGIVTAIIVILVVVKPF
ncbi:MAG TPA: CopD family protein [Allosphingosinicella sp.]